MNRSWQDLLRTPESRFGLMAASAGFAFALLAASTAILENEPVVNEAGWFGVFREAAFMAVFYVLAAIWLFRESGQPAAGRWRRRLIAGSIWLAAASCAQTLFIMFNRGLPLAAFPNVFSVAFGWRLYIDALAFFLIGFVSDAARARWFKVADRTQGLIEVQSLRQRHFIKTGDIKWIRSAANYVEICARGRVFIRRDTLISLKERLGADEFMRPHRRYLVRRSAVTSIETDNGETRLFLSNGDVIPVSRRRVAEIRKQIAS